MPRPRTYDVDEVLRAATVCFWEWGYDGATVTRLEEATGLDRRQLFREFGDKHRLFLASLQKFDEMAGAHYLGALEDPKSGIRDIRRTLMGFVNQGKHPLGQFGCLFCNTAREGNAMGAEGVAQAVTAHFARVERAYRGTLERALDVGETAIERSQLRAAARSLLATHMGMLVMVRAGQSKATLRDAADRALAAIEQ
ncbi:MAG: TetR family transcriptional regulator [Planctomycetota bacterium]